MLVAVLLDNDIVFKLAQLDLLADGLQLLSSMYGQIYILDTLKFQLQGRRYLKRYGSDAISRVQHCISQGNFSIFEDTITDHRVIDLHNRINDLDSGEMRLLQGLINHHDLLISGDKRFLKAIAETGFIEEAALNNRFVCLEQVICLLINKLSLDHINTKASEAFQSEFRIDSSLRTCIGVGRTREHVSEGISHQLKELPQLLLSLDKHWILAS